MPQQQAQQEEQYIAQAAAIPFRDNSEAGHIEVLLIRRRDGGKWGIPKGLVDPGLTHAEAAAMEAREEAGVEGRLSEEPVGSFTYDKFGGTCRVQVFTMRVTQILSRWDEQALRERQWFEIQEASRRVGREPVARLIARFAREMQDR
jgi:8-oxo-dGTP pyrophosphatase MutT (NUDIX family)